MTLDITLSLARAGHLEKPDAGKPEMRPHEPPNGSGCSSRFRPFVASPLLADVAPRRDDHDKRGPAIL
jgi:hypothetical protein